MLKVFGKTNKLSVVKDPFIKDKIQGIKIEWTKWSCQWQAKIRFKNGNTDGAQNFKHENFEVLMAEVNDFIQSI